MKIGIIGAMPEEIELLLDKLENPQKEAALGTLFYCGALHRKDIVLVKCGIGKVNAAVVTQFLITGYGVEAVINLGMAGAVVESLDIGDTVISKDLVYHDVMATAFGYKPGQIPGMDTFSFVAESKFTEIAEKFQGTVSGRIATGDQFVESAGRRTFIKDTFGALCVEMEGAAIAHTCYLNKIPFIVIRAVSDRASGDAFDEFKKNMDVAVRNSTDIAERIIKDI